MWILTSGQGGGLRPCQAMGDGAMGPLGGSSLDSEVTCPHKSHCVLGTNGCDSCMLLRLLTVKMSQEPWLLQGPRWSPRTLNVSSSYQLDGPTSEADAPRA